MYLAVKGGEAAIGASNDLLAETRRGDPAIAEILPDQLREQMSVLVARVMNEGALYDYDLSALALKQAQGDSVEAAFLVRAFRTTLPRFGSSRPLDSSAMAVRRRISATFKDVPGGQILGPTYDYTHRLFDFSLAEGGARPQAPMADEPVAAAMPRVLDSLTEDGTMAAEAPRPSDPPPDDITGGSFDFPPGRSARLQSLARGDEGFLLGLAYSVQRGFGHNHPFAGEIRMGEVAVRFTPEELGFEIDLGDITVTECQMVTQFSGSKSAPAQFTRGYGIAFGHNERKAMSMAVLDRSLKAREYGESETYPAQQSEFVLYHADNVEAAGFLEHLKLPHYVDFQSELQLVRAMRREQAEAEDEK